MLYQMPTVVKQSLPPSDVNCQILIENNTVQLSGKFPLQVVRKATSYYVQGYQFSPAFKLRKWDGRKHFFNLNSLSAPAGLAHLIIDALQKYAPNGQVVVTNKTKQHSLPIANAGFDLYGIEFGKDRYDYQLAAAQAMCDKHRGVLKCATNAGKSEMACAAIKNLGLPTIFLVERITLVHQFAKRFALRVQVPEESIGIVGDGKFTIGDWLTVATPTSLLNKINTSEIQFMLKKWQILILDECHRASDNTTYEVSSCIPAHYRFGMSGTPLDRTDGADLRLLAQTGPVIYEVSNKLLVDRGISVPPEVRMIKITEPKLPEYCKWQEVQKRGIVENLSLNTRLVQEALHYVNDGYRILILVDQIKHGQNLMNLLTSSSHRAILLDKVRFLTGAENTEERDRCLKLYTEDKIKILIATSILDEGVDVPCIDVLILAGGGESKIKLLQRAGRGLRSGKDKTKLLVIDIANYCHRYLAKHSLARLKTYKAEECFTVTSG